MPPGLIHNWVNQVLAQAEKAFEKTAENGRDKKLKDRRIEHLEAKLVNKNEVIAELMAVSPSSVYRVLRNAGRLDRNRWAPSKKGTGFVQPDGPHKHWHVDVSYINIDGTFYFLTSVLDGYSRYIVHHELRAAQKEFDVEIVIQKALEKFPGERPRIISDNGSQFTARDFKQFVRLVGITHVRTSPYYPQSNGKLEEARERRALSRQSVACGAVA